MQMRSVLVAAGFVAAVALAHTPAPLPSGGLEELHAWVSVTFNYSGSPWGETEADAVRAGAFIKENNVITGIAVWGDDIFVTVPRWRAGVPSTLNKVDNSSGRPMLVPWPSWEFNTHTVKYVQSARVDQTTGIMFVIDAGRTNFFDPDAKTHFNGPAQILMLNASTGAILYRHVFPDAIFPYNSSFLNDVVFDMGNTVAYMTDTNVAGNGALVSHNWTSGFSFRFESASTRADPTYMVRVLNVSYPLVNSPVDGIALCLQRQRLYYSPVEGARMFSLDAFALSAPTATHDSVLATVNLEETKRSFSDGLLTPPQLPPYTFGAIDRIWYGSNADAELRLYTSRYGVNPTDVLIARDVEKLQWVDTLCFVPFPGPAGQGAYQDGWVYFTTNRLQLFFFHTMDFHGGQGNNMRVFRVPTTYLPTGNA